MKIRYEVALDEPLEIDGDWPLDLPDGGLFRAKIEAGKVTAFEVEYSGRPSDHFGCRKDGVICVNDERWTRMRPFFARLKSFTQMESEANFDPMEVFAHYDSETETEKQEISVQKMVLTKRGDRRRRRPLDHEILGAAVLASYSGGGEPPPFIAELKSMSRRSKREGRYVDSFRYSFLIVDTLYGKGQFKTNQLVRALSSSEDLSKALNAARQGVRQVTGDACDETAKLLAGNCPIKDLIRHIVKQRGRYFHGSNTLKRTGDWASDEARTLCDLMSRTTDKICRDQFVEILSNDASDWYESNARRSGTLVDVVLAFGVRMRNSGHTDIVREQARFVGASDSLRVRLKWALKSVEQVQFSDDDLELESVLCKEAKSDQELFSIRMITTATRLDGTSVGEAWNEVRDPSGTYDLVWYFHEEEEHLTLQASEAAPLWHSGPEARAWVVYSIRHGLEFDHVGLHRIVCRGAAASAPLFEVRLGDQRDMVRSGETAGNARHVFDVRRCMLGSGR